MDLREKEKSAALPYHTIIIQQKPYQKCPLLVRFYFVLNVQKEIKGNKVDFVFEGRPKTFLCFLNDHKSIKNCKQI